LQRAKQGMWLAVIDRVDDRICWTVWWGPGSGA